MQKFFEPQAAETGGCITLSPENSAHIIRSLRMKPGEQLTVCCEQVDYRCVLESTAEPAVCRVLDAQPSTAEPSLQVTLYQCVTKGDKLELIVQKAVELGVARVQPVLSSRSISRPDERTAARKCERYNKIARSACEQCGRGVIVPVLPQISLAQAIGQLSEYDAAVLLYEGGGQPLGSIDFRVKSAALLVGPEGGWAESEVDSARAAGAVCATLGPRILRTETAPIAALSAVMLLSGNLE